jgi:hypothetical protein
LRDAWDDVNLKFSFRKTVYSRLMAQWHEILQIASSLQFGDDKDVIIWQFESSRKYSIHSLYSVINCRWIKPMYTLVMWKLVVPSRIHIFLWLLANNKILTRTNLAKRKKMDDMSCLFCNEQEDVGHLFSVLCS